MEEIKKKQPLVQNEEGFNPANQDLKKAQEPADDKTLGADTSTKADSKPVLGTLEQPLA